MTNAKFVHDVVDWGIGYLFLSAQIVYPNTA